MVAGAACCQRSAMSPKRGGAKGEHDGKLVWHGQSCVDCKEKHMQIEAETATDRQRRDTQTHTHTHTHAHTHTHTS